MEMITNIDQMNAIDAAIDDGVDQITFVRDASGEWHARITVHDVPGEDVTTFTWWHVMDEDDTLEEMLNHFIGVDPDDSDEVMAGDLVIGDVPDSFREGFEDGRR